MIPNRFDHNMEEKFREHLEWLADQNGFKDPKRAFWINYMFSQERGKNMCDHILSNLPVALPADASFIDIGCGFGNLLLAMQNHFTQLAGIDIVTDRINWSKQHLPDADIQCASATEIPWPDNTFDLATASDVFEHLAYKDQILAATEMFRVLKPGGIGYVSVPNRFQLKDEHNFVWFGTWMPLPLRRLYVQAVSKNESFTPAWERTTGNWNRLFQHQGFNVTTVDKPVKTVKKYIARLIRPSDRCELFLKKSQGQQ